MDTHERDAPLPTDRLQMRPSRITWAGLADHVRAVADNTGFSQAVQVIADDAPALRRTKARMAFLDRHLYLVIPQHGEPILPDAQAQRLYLRITRGEVAVNLALVSGVDQRELSCWTVRARAVHRSSSANVSRGGMHPPTPTCAGICVLPPPCWHPILHAPLCPGTCSSQLGAYATAAEILSHHVAHNESVQGRRLPAFRLTSEDQAKCLRFVQASLPCRASSAEAALLLMNVEGLALTNAIRHRRGPTLAKIRDCIQKSHTHILAHLTEYDPSRAGFSTWVFNWARLAAQEETNRGRFGYGFGKADAQLAGRLVEQLEAIKNPDDRPSGPGDLALFASRVLRTNISVQRAQGLLRFAVEVESLGAVSIGQVENAVPIGLVEDEQIDAHGMAILGDLTVRDALASVSRTERDELGSYVGLDGPAETRRSIAMRRGVSAGAVSLTMRRGAGRIKNTAALGALDQDAVDYRDSNF